MIQVLTILAFLALHVRDEVWGNGVGGAWHGPLLDASPLQTTLLVLSALALCALGAHAACVTAGRRIDRTGSITSLALVDRALLLSRVGATLLFVGSLFALDWLGVVRSWVVNTIVLDEFIALIPLFAMFMLTWGSAHSIDRRLRDAGTMRGLDSGVPINPGPTRFESILAHTRHGLAMVALPILLVTAWHESIERLRGHTGLSSDVESWTLGLASVGGTVGVFVLSPLILRAIWDTVPLGPGEVREMLTKLCGKYRVRMREPLVWRTHGSLVNGAVLGLLWPFRYLLFTDLLLERLLPQQVEAVAAHEVGHIHHKHILWLAISAIGTILGTQLVMTYVAIALGSVDTVWMAAVLMAIPLVAGVLVFGWVSRRFEWQADAFAARHLSEELGASIESSTGVLPGMEAGGSVNAAGATPPAGMASSGRVTTRKPIVLPAAVAWMQSALKEVARLNGAEPARATFRHGSIDERVRRLRQIAGLSTAMFPIDNTVRWVKVLALMLFLASIAGVLIESFLANGR